MNDLFTSASFKKYADLKHQVVLDDLESGGGGIEAEAAACLDRFFEDVEGVKEDLCGLEALHRRLQAAHEESKTAHDARAVKALRARMDADVDQVLLRAKAVKSKLEALDRANAASRRHPGCGPGSSTDRTRTSVITGLGKKLKDLMGDFQVGGSLAGSLDLFLDLEDLNDGECRAFGRAWWRSTRRRWRGGTTR